MGNYMQDESKKITPLGFQKIRQQVLDDAIDYLEGCEQSLNVFKLEAKLLQSTNKYRNARALIRKLMMGD